jgi:hypothetical protein
MRRTVVAAMATKRSRKVPLATSAAGINAELIGRTLLENIGKSNRSVDYNASNSERGMLAQPSEYF